ncbi:MAG: ABC transporter substrate-binding protein, partial [Planctomycetota bacterium]
MKLTKLLSTSVLGAGLAFAATAAFAGSHAKEVTVMSWGGAYTKSQVEAYHKPFTEKTGVKVNSVDSDNPAKPIRTQVEAGNVTVDVADVEYSDAIRLCDEGLIEPIDTSGLPAAPDGTAAKDDFIEGALTDCAVANIVWSTVYAYDTTKFSGDKPSTIGDFFDTKKFPGKRGMRKNAKANLEMALMADGVPADKVYEVLGTAEGVDRAFKKLDTIKNDIVWWEAGAQPPQLLADGEVSMSTAYNGLFSAATALKIRPLYAVDMLTSP